MSVAQIGLISNPNARENRRNPGRVTELASILGAHGTVIETASVDDLPAAAERLRDSGISYLALNGGDGTNHRTLSAFVEVWGERPLPRLVILRGGTMNTVANGLGVHGTPTRILRGLVERLAADIEPETRQTVLLEARADDGPRQYGFIFGSGIVAGFLRAYYDHGDVSPFVAAQTLAAAVGSTIVGGPLAARITARQPFSVTTDGALWVERPLISLLAASVAEIGLGFTPFPRCNERPDAYHAVAIAGELLDVVLALPRIYRGMPLLKPAFEDVVTARMDIACPAAFDYTVDGDLYRAAERLTLSAGPRVEVVLPSRRS